MFCDVLLTESFFLARTHNVNKLLSLEYEVFHMSLT